MQLETSLLIEIGRWITVISGQGNQASGMSRRTRLLGAVCGLLAVSAFVILYSVAMHLDNEYVFMDNYLSDLGVSEGAWAFNSGVIISGALFILMDLLAIAPALGKGKTQWASVALLLVAAGFLISVGIFTEDAGDLHGFVSYGFFLSMLVALGALAFALHISPSFGRPVVYVTLAAFVFGLALIPFGGTPEVETLAVLGILTWGSVMSLVLLRLWFIEKAARSPTPAPVPENGFKQ